jgi:hypothetical protein
VDEGNIRWGGDVFDLRQGKMHGKLFLCRALRKKRTANNFFAERFFTVRYGKDARQRSPLSCARKITHGKDFQAWQTRVFP